MMCAVSIHYENLKPERRSDYDWIPKTNWLVSSTSYDYYSIIDERPLHSALGRRKLFVGSVNGKLKKLNRMEQLHLHSSHKNLDGRFIELNGMEAVADYGNMLAEQTLLAEKAAVLDLSFRSRVCLTGADRVRFLHGQITNDVKGLAVAEGCYAALVTAKGRMESDLNVYRLPDELLLDFEPGLAKSVSERLEKYIVADDVQIVDVAGLYGLLSVQGPQAGLVVECLAIVHELPTKRMAFSKSTEPTLGELYVVNQPRVGTNGFDLFVPSVSLEEAFSRLVSAAQEAGGGVSGWEAFEMSRVEAGIPRFGQDMDESNFPQECGIETRAVSYTKGCYIGQEVLNRIHTQGHVNRQLCGLRLSDNIDPSASKGAKLFHAGKEIGTITSAVSSHRLRMKIALGHVRREANGVGTELILKLSEGEGKARIVELPFRAE